MVTKIKAEFMDEYNVITSWKKDIEESFNRCIQLEELESCLVRDAVLMVFYRVKSDTTARAINETVVAKGKSYASDRRYSHFYDRNYFKDGGLLILQVYPHVLLANKRNESVDEIFEINLMYQ